MPLVGASPVYRPPLPGEPLRLREDGHWSTDGLVGYWPMREMRGETVQDVSRFENHGTFVGGAPYWIGSRWGPALKFQTLMDEMQVASDPLRGATTFTVAAWLRYDGFVANWQRCWGRWQKADDEKGWGFWRPIRTEGNVEGYKWNFIWSQNGRYDASLALAGPANIVAGQWYALAVTYDSATMRLYIDGVEVASRNWSGTLSTVDVPITTGAYDDRLFNGRVYSQYIAGRALTATEIAALYADPYLPIWRPRRGISLALVGEEGGAVPMVYRAARRRSRTLIPGMVVLP